MCSTLSGFSGHLFSNVLFCYLTYTRHKPTSKLEKLKHITNPNNFSTRKTTQSTSFVIIYSSSSPLLSSRNTQSLNFPNTSLLEILRAFIVFLFFFVSLRPDFMASTSLARSKGMIEDMEAFDGVAPSSSTCVSKIIKKPSYDVFINHRGPDVKKTLATTLYAILTAMALSVFLDSEELEYGDFLPRTIEAAMTTALLHIAIFSETYAESPWCLAELSFMLKSGAPIIPIFYHVEPTDLRRLGQGKGMYVEAFRKHEEKGRYSMEQLQDWKEALYKVSFYKGQIIQTNEDEMELQKNIVATVSKVKNNVPLPVAKHPVGLKEIVQDFEMNTVCSFGRAQDVQIVGIWGMGGSGKTTLAQELYNKYSSSTDRCSFIFDVREGAAKGLLQNKQIQLLKDLGVQNQTFDNVEQGKAILIRHLRSAKVLFVFDDVDHKDQLDALLPVKDNLGGGSLIIVTTREFKVFKSWGIYSVYKMKPLDFSCGEKIFCWHAFLRSDPPNEFEELVKKFVKICNGLPLSLKVFGGQLYGEFCRQYWESLLHKISRILPDDIKNRIKISYDVLDVEEKEMFLDIVCFFIGKEISLAIEVWNGSGWSGLHGWETLQNKCLVDINIQNQIIMHDHLRDLGREIANQHQPYRFWSPQQIFNADGLIEKRSIAVRGIMEDQYEYRRYFEEPPPSLVGVKIFVIRGDDWNKVIGELSRELVWLCWFGIGLKNLPSQISLKNLRVLQLSQHEAYWNRNNLEELWDDNNAPVQLRELFISNCHQLRRVPDSIGCLRELKKIVIVGGNSIWSLPEEFCYLQSLEHLQLSGAPLLKLPDAFGNLKNLRYLHMRFCSELVSLPASFRNLMLLQHLNLGNCEKLMLFSEDFQHIRKLEYLNLTYCKQVEELPRHITNQTSLTELDLEGMWSLRELPSNISQLSKLRKMVIQSCMLTSLPHSLGDLSSLTHLSIISCWKLDCLQPVWSLVPLETLRIEGCPISKISISDGRCPHLELLELSCNNKLMEIEPLPPNLKWLKIGYCSKLEEFPSFERLTSIRGLQIENCSRIEKIEGLEYCTRLETLKVHSKWEMPVIESLERMELLRTVDFKASDGSVIPRCIQTIQKLPGEIMICARAVPDAASLVNSSLPPDLLLLDFLSDQKIGLDPTSFLESVFNGDTLLLCFIIDCHNSSTFFYLPGSNSTWMKEGKWVWVVLCTQRSNREWLRNAHEYIAAITQGGQKHKVDRGLLVRGEDSIVVKAFHSLVPALIATSTTQTANSLND